MKGTQRYYDCKTTNNDIKQKAYLQKGLEKDQQRVKTTITRTIDCAVITYAQQEEQDKTKNTDDNTEAVPLTLDMLREMVREVVLASRLSA